MQTHGFGERPVNTTQWALLRDAILPPIPRVNTDLATHDRFATSSENHRGDDRGKLANATLECNGQLVIQGSGDFHSFFNLKQTLHVFPKSMNVILDDGQVLT